MSLFLYAPGDQVDHGITTFPRLKYDPDYLVGLTFGLGPQRELSEHFFVGADLSVGGGLGASQEACRVRSGALYLTQHRHEYYPSLMAYSSAYVGFSVGDHERSFVVRLMLNAAFATAKENLSLTFPIAISAGMGF